MGYAVVAALVLDVPGQNLKILNCGEQSRTGLRTSGIYLFFFCCCFFARDIILFKAARMRITSFRCERLVLNQKKLQIASYDLGSVFITSGDLK